ncbi:LysR family transcriptional regulator [Prosthecomicrobium sp. N25]|uniref:LysR family transcriptional regulator n=1 Tax=Prosthecomicrobium sp. N25 TaxID=3129254 RepID=UPI003078223F
MRHLNFHHLRLFWTIAHEGGLTRAAERLNLSQSALSVQLAKLEESLGHALFERQGKRLVLTEAGRIALDYADTVFAAGAELLDTLGGRPASRRRVLRVGALPTLSRNFQMQFLRPLAGRADTELVLRSGSLRELLIDLEAHMLDVVLANAAVRRDAHSDLHSHLLAEQAVSLVGRPAASAAPLRFPEDLAGTPVVLPSLASEIRAGFDRILELAGIRPVIVAEVDDMAMLRLIARETDALTLVPAIVVRDELEAGLLVERYRVRDLTERFFAVVQSRRFPNSLVAEVLEAFDRTPFRGAP